MIRETYKGRKLAVKKEAGRSRGYHGVYVNGQLVTLSTRPPDVLIEQTRRDVDAVELRPEAYADYWFST